LAKKKRQTGETGARCFLEVGRREGAKETRGIRGENEKRLRLHKGMAGAEERGTLRNGCNRDCARGRALAGNRAAKPGAA